MLVLWVLTLVLVLLARVEQDQVRRCKPAVINRMQAVGAVAVTPLVVQEALAVGVLDQTALMALTERLIPVEAVVVVTLLTPVAPVVLALSLFARSSVAQPQES